jgi:predicted glycogen debranching enzyme
LTHASILERPFVRFGREVARDPVAAFRREWLVTNGLGGYASGSLMGPATRRYHGLLVASLAPPVERTVVVQGSLEWLVDTTGGERTPLSTHEYGDGTIDPAGYLNVESFELDGALPVWRFGIGGVVIERRVWMPTGRNATWIAFRLVEGKRLVEIEFTPLVTCRDFHSLATPSQVPEVEVAGPGLAVRFGDDMPTLRVVATHGSTTPAATRYRDFLHREETARGLDDRSDAFAVGTIGMALRPGETAGVLLSIEPDPERDLAEGPDASLARARERQVDLNDRAGAIDAELAVQQLVLAADQFLVERRPAARTVIAGYHWFNDWGRDTMIALSGLTLATGRSAEGAAILRSFAPLVRDGLLPNNFPDRGDADPAYNTVDASLWYVVAIGRHLEATGDEALLPELLPVVREIVDRHIEGTRFGIGMDPADGLLRSGEPSLQLTWMDVKIGDWVVTPRIGKPVEISALWYNVLRYVSTWLTDLGDPAGTTYRDLADRVLASFRARFACADEDHLADVVDGPDGDDRRLRPNQIFAISLPHPLLDGDAARRVLDSVERSLATGFGLRTLPQTDPEYRGEYGGDQLQRDSGYHQGPVWTWLAGAYVEAHLRVHGDPAAARALLAPFEDHLRDAGLGTISEILEGDPPHEPRGCIAQAWGVAEVLRAWRLVDAAARASNEAPQ